MDAPCIDAREFLNGVLWIVRWLVLFLTVQIPQFTAAATPPLLPESLLPELKPILKTALDRSWRMIEEDLRLEIARSEREVFAAGGYPTVTGSIRYLSRVEDREDIDRTRRLFQPHALIAIRQPIYHWGSLASNRRIGEIRARMAENNHAEVYRLLLLEIRAIFLELAVHRKAIAVAERRHEMARRELAIAEARFTRGEITDDELRANHLSAQEAGLRLDRIVLEQERLVEKIVRLAGIEPPVEDWMAEIPRIFTETHDAGLEKNIANINSYHPWLDIAQNRVQQAMEQYTVESVRQRPRLDLVGGVTQDQIAVFGRDDIDRTSLFVGIEVTWDIFDGFESRGRRRAALAHRRLEERRMERQRSEWAAEIQRLETSVEASGRELKLQEEKLELSCRRLAQRREDFERGLISETSFYAAKLAYSENDLAVAEARAAYLLAIAELISESGVDPMMEYYSQRAPFSRLHSASME